MAHGDESSSTSSVCEGIKLVVGTCVVLTLVSVVFACVALGYSILTAPIPVNFLLMFMCLTLLAYVEALHYAVVAVEKWDMNSYAEKFPRAFKCWKLVDTPTKVKKFLVGRQFFVIFVVFLLAEITTFPCKQELTSFSSIVSLLTTRYYFYYFYNSYSEKLCWFTRDSGAAALADRIARRGLDIDIWPTGKAPTNA